MEAVDDTDAEARRIQRDIERTREEMDQTLTALEQRLAPSEILHQGARTLRERMRSGITSTVETLQEHPAPIAFASALLGAALAFRPSAADRRRRQAEEDFERAWAVLTAAATRATERSRLGAATLAEQTWRAVQRAGEESRDVTRVLRREAGTHPLGVLVLLGVATGIAALGTRGVRAWR